jgi:hypothetical protein
MPASALLVTGTVGAGKSVTADMIGSLLQARLVPHAIIDLDEIRRRWPAPPDDPFDFELELRNLQPVATNYLAAGARRLVMAGVCESRKDRDRLAAAVGVPLVVCRLRVPLASCKLDFGSDMPPIRLALRGIWREPGNWIRSWMPLMSPTWNSLPMNGQRWRSPQTLPPLLAGVQVWNPSSSRASHNDKAVCHRFDGLRLG